jgi:hypothetical protein
VVLEIVSVNLLNQPSKIPSVFRKSFANYYQGYNRSIITFDTTKARYDSAYFYIHKPDTTVTFQNIEFTTTVRTNSRGLRDDNSSLTKPDIICVGDSYTFGWGVDEGESFPDILEKLSGYKVLNTGVSSFGTAREMKLFSSLDTTNLKYLIIQYCDNDEPENKQDLSNNFNLKISPKSVYDAAVNEQILKEKYIPGKVFLLTSVQFLTQPYYYFTSFVKSKIQKQDHEARPFLEILRHSNIDFDKVTVIVTYLSRYDYLTNPVISEIEKLSQEPVYKKAFKNHLRLLNLSSKIKKDDFFILDVHLRPSGQAKVANALAEVIETKDAKR